LGLGEVAEMLPCHGETWCLQGFLSRNGGGDIDKNTCNQHSFWHGRAARELPIFQNRFSRFKLLAHMRKPGRVVLIVGGAVAVIMAGFVVFFALCANDIITFTKKTQSIALPGRRTLNIYRTSTWEFYEFKFELLDTYTKKVFIPKTHFAWKRYWGTLKSTPESRTAYVPLIGTRSGIVGLVSPEDREGVLLIIDAAGARFVAPSPSEFSEADKALGQKLLTELRRDYPDQTLVLNDTEEAFKFRRRRSGLDVVR
jgi:hypothetical protein